MDQCNEVEKPLLERIQSELEADPDLYNVTFSVGPQKTKVKALKIILMAASPVFKNEFKTKWDHAVVRDGDGISLPEFDSKSFQLFVKLTSLDTWSVKVLRKLNLQPNQLLDLLHICRCYEMRTAVKNLKQLTAAFIRSFAKFKDTAFFLKLPQTNLKEVLANDDLPLEEMEVFKCALKWAEWQCREKKIDASAENLRHVLGDCLFEIRFPIMSNVDFTNALELKELLTGEEALKIYKYIGLDNSKRETFNVLQLAFKAKIRNQVFSAKKGSNSAELQPQPRQSPVAHKATQTFKSKPFLCAQPMGAPTVKPPGCSTFSLLSKRRKIEAKTPFVCNGSHQESRFRPGQGIALVGLGFAGPIDADAFYDVTVEIKDDVTGKSFMDETIKKSLFALKDQTFYFLFDQPITVEKLRFSSILYTLKVTFDIDDNFVTSSTDVGPNTSSVVGGHNEWTPLNEGSNAFDLWFESNQLSEILFKRL